VVVDLEKTVEPDPVQAGELLWTLRVSNVSGSAAANITVVDELPDTVIYMGLANEPTNGWTCLNAACAAEKTGADGSGGTLRFMIDELAPDDGNPKSGLDETVIVFRTHVKDGLADGTVIENWASATPEFGIGGQDNADITLAQLKVRKEQSALDCDDQTATVEVLAGDPLTYTITAVNEFDQAVFLRIYDALDHYIEYIAGSLRVNDATASDSFIQSGALDYAHSESIAPGETFSLSFDALIAEPAPTGWFITNIATLTPCLGVQDSFGCFVSKPTNRTVAQVVAAGQEPPPDPSAVPEPSTLLLVGIGMLAVLRHLRKKRKTSV